MVREGQLKYSVSAGRYNSNSDDQQTPEFVSTTMAYGISSNLSAIVGTQATEDFQAVSVGAGRNTAIGAISLDLVHSSSTTFGQTVKNNSLRALYANTFTGTDTDTDTDTNFTLAAYRYSTEGYRTLSEHAEELSNEGEKRTGNSPPHRPDRHSKPGAQPAVRQHLPQRQRPALLGTQRFAKPIGRL